MKDIQEDAKNSVSLPFARARSIILEDMIRLGRRLKDLGEQEKGGGRFFEKD